MRRVAPLVLLLACANAPPRPLPSAAWAHGAAAYLHWVGEELTANPGRTGYLVEVRDAIAQDLRSAGFRILPQPAHEGEYVVDLAMTDGAWPDWAVRVAREDRTLDGFIVGARELTCARWSVAPACIGREIAARILESKRLSR
ncbi:MAG: hypothetical protein ACXWLM_05370 [Myxococcales bacterium]